MVPFIEDLSVEKLHVQAPTEVIFLCGGKYNSASHAGTSSMRDAFMKVSNHPALGGREVVLAEHITTLSIFSKYYEDILEFETDLAQITELILLFCESEGSFAELGSFASIQEIAKRLLVIIRDHNWNIDSFITLGPLRFMRRKYEKSVFVLEDELVGIKANSVSNIDLDKFKLVLDEPLRARLSSIKEPSTFNAARPGHIIKLIVGLVQEYGALKFDEVEEILPKFGVNITQTQIGAYLLCAKSIGWIEEKTIGFNSFIVSLVDQPSITFVASEEAEVKNRARRKLLIRKHWEINDAMRFRAISKAVTL